MAFGDDPPEAYLAAARTAGDAGARAHAAVRGLARPGLERDTQSLLLRQLYLAQLQGEQFAAAADSAEQMVELDEMTHVARADAARAYLALGDYARAVTHQRL